ncbi:Na+/H+ antiporter NhaC family protein, partial [Clostridium tertium]
LAFIVITALLAKDFGPMRDAELRAKSERLNNLVDGNLEDKEKSDLEPKEGIKLSIWNAIIPIGTLIITALISFYYSGYSSIMSSEDQILIQLFTNSPFSFEAIKEAFSASDASVALFQSALFASIVGIAMAVSKKIFTIS